MSPPSLSHVDHPSTSWTPAPTQQFSDTVGSSIAKSTTRSSHPPLWYPRTGKTHAPSPTIQLNQYQPPPHEQIPPKRTWQQAKSSSSTSTNSFIQPTSSNATTKLILMEQLRIRELRRQRQIRYRKKKDDYANSLEVETHELRQVIMKLQKRRRSLADVVPAEESAWSIATEYFRLFRHGYCAFKPQDNFVRSRMTDDVVFNGERGPKAIVVNWLLLSQWFEDIEFELDSLDKSGVNSLQAVTRTSVTITKQTLHTAFCCEEVEKVEKLHGQRIILRGSMRFTWDPVSRRMSTVVAQSDMLTPKLRRLGTLEDVSCMFEKALVSPEFQLR